MKKRRKLGQDNAWGYLMIAPTIIGLIILNVYPFIDTIILSFCKSGVFGGRTFAGLTNYIEMFSSGEFWQAAWNTVYFCILTVPVGVFIALIVAILLNAKIKGKVFFRAVFFLPMVVAPAAVAMVWKWMFNSEYGIINTVFHLDAGWITDPNLVIPTVAIVAIWSAIGYDAVLLLSGIQNISKSYYEAASLDGCTKLQQFRYITLPMVSPTLFVVLIYVALIIGALIMIFPFIWMVLTAVKTNAEVLQVPPTILPENWDFSSFTKVFDLLPFGHLYLNTGLMILFRVLCAVIFSSMAGYAFAKLNFKGKNILFTLVIIQQMIPGQIFIIPQYEMVAGLGLTDSIFSLVFPGLVSAFGTFFLRQAYMGIPDEIAEAAYLDGCTRWQTFTKVLFPLTKSSVAALTVFTAVFSYADLMWPLVANTNINSTTLSAGLSTLNSLSSTNYPVLMAGSLFAMLPMVILYLIFQRQFIEGVAMTGHFPQIIFRLNIPATAMATSGVRLSMSGMRAEYSTWTLDLKIS